ncbi:hypothetical protein C5167_041959 [Papaver somniferum]|nr:hypothetical protein C5167_041959 [Papaver somniferum]
MDKTVNVASGAESWVPSINQVLKDKPDLSRWSLKYRELGQDIEFSWLARNMQQTMFESYDRKRLLQLFRVISIF